MQKKTHNSAVLLSSQRNHSETHIVTMETLTDPCVQVSKKAFFHSVMQLRHKKQELLGRTNRLFP
jgi:hypothetical protein